ncbi:MAG: tetratricopeptide repeat protein [Bacteroidetes bacterium]|nr:tetratricopeptide repeat protein [Bacteroidota bacterium]
MFTFRNCAVGLFFLLGFGACKNSDSWLSRQWHNTNAHYNIYFNADQKWQLTVQGIRESNPDDYRTFISLFNYGSPESLKANLGAMDEVVKKASTMIDKHPKSRWVDDAYLLIGKAYFMKGDFIAANEIFEYVNSTFKDPMVKYDARLWIFQCLMFQGKLHEAEDLVVSLKSDKEFPSKLTPMLNKCLGAIYLKNNKPSQAVKHMELCLKGIKGKMEKYRLHFALGQAYQKLEKFDSAENHFSKVVRMNPPYEMAFHSRINQVEILSLQKHDYAKANQLLRKMLKDDKNIEYFGQIYYRMGRNELRARQDIRGLQYLNLSVRNSPADKAQTTTSYLALGDYYYEHRDFERAGLYYDSANNFLDEKHPDFATISKKSLMLTDLLRHLITIKRQDSLLRLAKDPVLREKTIDRLIELEKKKAQNNSGTKPSNPGTNPDPIIPGINAQQNMGSFPFYNMNSRNRGIQDFQNNWGARTNRDYWRINSKKSNSSEINNQSDNDTVEQEDTARGPIPADRKKYYRDIPMTASAQKESEAKIEESFFAVAGIYQNSFGEKKQAIFYYEQLLKRYPNTKYKAQVYYELAKIAKSDNQAKDYEKYRGLLESEFPESIYLKLLDNPNAAKNDGNKGPGMEKREIEVIYENMYAAYLKDNFTEAISIKQEADRKFAGNNLQPKFDYLYALCLIKKGDVKDGMNALEQILSDYPDLDVAERARATLDAYDKIQRGAVSTVDSGNAGGELWKGWDGKEELTFLLVYPKGANSNLLRAGLNDFNKENFVFENLEVGIVVNIGSTNYLSVANFSKPEVAQGYMKMLMGKADFFASKGLFEYELAWISKTNFVTLSQNGRISSYMDFFKTDKK